MGFNRDGSDGSRGPVASGHNDRPARTSRTTRRLLLVLGVFMIVAAVGLAGLVVLQQDPAASAADEEIPAAELPSELLSLAEGQTTDSAGATADASAEEELPRNHPATGAPRTLAVPKLGVSARVAPIEMNRKTVLWPPEDPQIIGWWRSGSKPGAHTGSALLIGHSVSTGGGAFDALDTLKRGDPLRVKTLRGTVPYDVTSVRIYRKASLAQDAQRVFSQSVPGRLVLVTCEDWNGETWLSNAVVTAEPS